MSMSKKDFIALANVIKAARIEHPGWFGGLRDSQGELALLADFCKRQNDRFNRERWLGYIAGTNGPSGGAR